jgi:hypothetical protein
MENYRKDVVKRPLFRFEIEIFKRSVDVIKNEIVPVYIDLKKNQPQNLYIIKEEDVYFDVNEYEDDE